ncbi:unnamed protein product, partial [Musa acuminata var. zebrina]
MTTSKKAPSRQTQYASSPWNSCTPKPARSMRGARAASRTLKTKGRLTRAVLSTGGRGLLVNDEPPRGGGASHPAVSRGTEMRSEVCSH